MYGFGRKISTNINGQRMIGEMMVEMRPSVQPVYGYGRV